MSGLRSAFKNPSNKKADKRVHFGSSQSQDKQQLGKRQASKSSTSGNAVAEKRPKTSNEYTESVMLSCEQNEVAQVIQEYETKITKQSAQYRDLANEITSFTKTVSDLSSKAQKFESFISQQNEALHEMEKSKMRIIDLTSSVETDLKSYVCENNKKVDLIEKINDRNASLVELNIDPNNLDVAVLEDEMKQFDKYAENYEAILSDFETLVELC